MVPVDRALAVGGWGESFYLMIVCTLVSLFLVTWLARLERTLMDPEPA